MKYTRVWLLSGILLAAQAVVLAGPYERLWSEDFEGYALGDLPSQDVSWTSHGVLLGNTVAATPPFTMVDYGLKAWVADANDNYHLGYALKDLSGELAATDSRRIAFEFDAWIYSRASQIRAQETGYRLQDPCENDIVYLMTRNTSVEGIYQLNGAAVTGERWVYGLNHYKIDIDFVADTVAVYVDYEDTPRVSTSLPADFEPEDIRYLRLDAAIYYTAGRSMGSYVDDMELYDNRDWVCPDGDVNADCLADLDDVIVLADHWLEFDIDPNAPE